MTNRLIKLQGNIAAADDDTFGFDKGHVLIFGEAFVRSDDRPVKLGHYELRVGGEVRAELDVHVSVRASLTAEVTGLARLFEGTSSDTNDLDGSRSFSFTVPPFKTVKHLINLENGEAGSFDWAVYDFAIENSGDVHPIDLPKQDQWRWCEACNGLWFAGGGGAGRCPAGGAHQAAGSGNYGLVNGITYPGGQELWRWCRDCLGLWFSGAAGKGRCPAGGGHTSTDSGNYVLTEAADGPGQRGWRWCNRCMGLFFGQAVVPGVCPAGGSHNSEGSGDYVIPHF